MKKLYAIGEVSKIMGVSVQTLRYYANIKLVEPEYISPETGYRYYSYEQFSFIDRIRYLQQFGFSLGEIKSILLRNDINKLVTMLADKKKEVEKNIADLSKTADMINWYHDYFIQSQTIQKTHISHLDERYLVLTKIKDDESKEQYHVRLQSMKNTGYLKTLTYKRQFSLLFNYNDFIRGQNKPTHIGMFLNNKPDRESKDIVLIPEGNYFCMTSHILCEECNPYAAIEFFGREKKIPSLVLANEYENNLHEYTNCPYEIQILIP